jgi:tRNA G10  N-methylase Trm11
MTVAGSSLVTLSAAHERAAPPFEGNDIKFPDSYARHFIGLYSRKGARVFDPFAGLGTTLFVAEDMGRRAFGIEADPRRQEWVAGQLRNWTGLRLGDSARMDAMDFPKMDFCITSPPFMPMTDKWNPLCDGDPRRAGYEAYLKRLSLVFRRLTGVMKRKSMLVVHADNIAGRRFTPLVRDMAASAARSWRQTDDVVVRWQGTETCTHALVFCNDLEKKR